MDIATIVGLILGMGLVLGSIAMFGVIYALLFGLWVFLLNRAIQQGPKPIDEVKAQAPRGDAFSAITARAAHDPSPNGSGEGEA